MRLVIQRVARASVSVDDTIISSIEKGALVLLGVHKEDDPKNTSWLVQKLIHLRMFEDPAGKMNLSIKDVGGSCLIVSQFTLYADCSEGRRPDFFEAARPEIALPIYEKFVEEMRREIPVQTGKFGASMQVELVNDGPVTFIVNGK